MLFFDRYVKGRKLNSHFLGYQNRIKFTQLSDLHSNAFIYASKHKINTTNLKNTIPKISIYHTRKYCKL